MRILVCGGRNYANADAVAKAIYDAERDAGSCATAIIHGGATGADALAKQWAVDRGVPHIEFAADWAGLGRKAGPIRNARMLAEGAPDVVVAMPGGRGTADMVHRAEAAGVFVYQWADTPS